MKKVYGIIYLIINKNNNKKYVGQTKNSFKKRYEYAGVGIERVYKKHIKLREIGKGSNEHLISSIEKYGYDSFEVIEEFDVAYSQKELDDKERYYIKYFKSNDRNYGYNKTEGGQNIKLGEITKNLRKEGKIDTKKEYNIYLDGLYFDTVKGRENVEDFLNTIDDVNWHTAKHMLYKGKDGITNLNGFSVCVADGDDKTPIKNRSFDIFSNKKPLINTRVEMDEVEKYEIKTINVDISNIVYSPKVINSLINTVGFNVDSMSDVGLIMLDIKIAIKSLFENKKLDDIDINIIELYSQGLSGREIAREIGRDKTSVRQRLDKISKRIFEYLKD